MKNNFNNKKKFFSCILIFLFLFSKISFCSSGKRLSEIENDPEKAINQLEKEIGIFCQKTIEFHNNINEKNKIIADLINKKLTIESNVYSITNNPQKERVYTTPKKDKEEKANNTDSTKYTNYSSPQNKTENTEERKSTLLQKLKKKFNSANKTSLFYFIFGVTTGLTCCAFKMYLNFRLNTSSVALS